MLAHTVIFWLKDNLSEDQRNNFREGLESLKGIPHAEAICAGAPAKTGDRPIIDKTYSFGLTVLFATVEDHDRYQVHPLHQAFLQKFVPLCSKITVFDFDEVGS
jgi:hypothetical protein